MRKTTPLAERFWAKVDRRGPDECWPWMANILPSGYGRVFISNRDGMAPAHRVSYVMHKGELPPGLTIDHTCHTYAASCSSDTNCQHRRCVNPAHLEAVTVGENLRRSYANVQALLRQRVECNKGHAFSPENTMLRSDGGRRCRTCEAERNYNRRLAKRAR